MNSIKSLSSKLLRDLSASRFLVLLVCILFLFISYSPHHYWDEYFYLYSTNFFSLSELLAMESELAKGLFPQAFFSSKYAFILFLYLLGFIFPAGEFSLHAIQFVFAGLVIALSGVSYLLLKELFEKSKAQQISIVLLFLPLSIYFSYKSLSEVFSLIWVVLACCYFLRSFSSKTSSKFLALITLSILFLTIAVLSRFTSITFFCALVISLFLISEERYPRVKLCIISLGVFICSLALTLIAYRFLIGLSLDDIAGLMSSVTVRTHGIAIKIYSTFMVLQLFVIPLIFLFKNIISREIGFAIIWAMICALPFLFLSDYVEPRYFYMAMLPIAILSYYGIMLFIKSFRWLKNVPRVRGFYAVLLTIVISNKIFLSDLMPYELDQKDYNELLTSIELENPSPTYIVPWISDFGLLSYMYPEKKIHLAWSAGFGEQDDFFAVPMFRKWAGEQTYVHSANQLKAADPPLYYIGWRYNQPAVEIKSKMRWLESGYINTIEVEEGLKNHLAQSWIWEHPDLELIPKYSNGQYEAFLIR